MSFLARYIAEQPTLALIAAIVDISIVYYLIYRLLLLIKGTRAVPMVIGLILIILAFFASEFAGLATLNWLLNSFFSVILLVVVVVFQQDIRRGLTRIGMTRIFQSASSTRTAYLIEEMVKVATTLAAKSIGAIICIEREADNRRVRGGVRGAGRRASEQGAHLRHLRSGPAEPPPRRRRHHPQRACCLCGQLPAPHPEPQARGRSLPGDPASGSGGNHRGDRRGGAGGERGARRGFCLFRRQHHPGSGGWRAA